MTRDEIVKIIDSCVEYNYSIHGEQEIFHTEELADRIKDAFDKEREGEVVLEPKEICKGRFCGKYFYHDGKRGQLIFRPTKGDK